MSENREFTERQVPEDSIFRTQDFKVGSFCPEPPEMIPLDEREHEWAISGSILSILWSDTYPRLVALVMNGDILPPPIGDSVGCRDWIVNNLHDPNLAPPVPRPYSEFIRRRDLLEKYLKLKDSVPITFRGWGSYDFILSDQGIDLFGPPPLGVGGADPARQLFQFYQIRSTGEAPIGMPLFMDSKVRNIVMDAPDGPAQVYLPSAAIDELLNCGCREREEGEREPQRESVPYETVVQYLGRRRVWWIEGSVVRGILGQLPRIVATIWYEDSLGVNPVGGYRDRYPNPDNDGLRTIFAERMETTLPLYEYMAFEVQPTPAPFPPTPINGEAVDHRKGPAQPQKGDPHGMPFWDTEDVMITAKGIYVPKLPKKPPGVGDIMDAVADGRAGNPVFTSTWLCNII